MKKFVAIVLLIALCTTMFFSAAAEAEPPAAATDIAAYTDTPEAGHWSYDGIAFVIQNRLMGSTHPDSLVFEPETPMTRAMFTAVLYRMQNSPEVKKAPPFSDTDPNAWYADAVAWAYENQIVYGVSEELFAPDDPITREQIACLMVRYAQRIGMKLGSDAGKGEFADEASISGYAVEAVAALRQSGLMLGDNHNNFLPQKNTSRAEAAVILYRLCTALETPDNPDNPDNPDTTNARNLTAGLMRDAEAKGTKMTQEQAEAIADFSVRLFQYSAEDQKSTVISPTSALYALAMVTNGAAGTTRTELESAFGMTTRQLNPCLRGWADSFADESASCKLSVANSAWFDSHAAVHDDFLQETVNWYDADVFSAPMDQSTVDDINRWVSNHTDEMIEQIISDLPPATLMCLVNALMFKANWGDPYECTVDRTFFMEDGTEKTVPMLAGTEHYYINDGNAEGFVKYYQERRYAFAVLMPTNEEPLSEYVKSLTGSGIRQTLENKTAYDAVHAYMPKFEASTELDLVSPLQRMGIRTVFDPYCSELSGMTDWYPCWISNVRHNAVIKVDENGTSAAAATSVIEPGGSAPDPEHEITVVIDHPYVYMILDMENNIPLFIGTQYNP